MRRTSWFRPLAAAGLLMLLVTAVPAAPKKDPPGTSATMSQLRALFAAWDLNSDGYIDKEELAKAFRGPNAKPYDYKPEKKSDKDKPKDDDAKDDPKKDDDKPKDADEKDVDKKDSEPGKDSSLSKGAGGSSTKPDYSKYPDYLFLTQLDTNNDERISKDEFETWARDYAVQLKQRNDALKQVEKLQAKLATATKGEQKHLQGEIKKEQEALNKLARQMKGFEKSLQQQMNKQK